MAKVKRAIAIQISVLIVVIAAVLWVVTTFPVVDWIEAAQHWIAGKGTWGAILYPLFYALCNVLLLPAGVLSIGGGLFFGLWWGFAIVLTGNVLGAAFAFLISRTIGRDWVARRFFRYRKWRVLDQAIDREGWKIVVLSQIHPLFPTSLINYLYGVTRIGFWRCMLWVLIGQAPGIFLYTYFGTLAQHGIEILKGRNHPDTLEYVLWGGGLVLTLVVTTGLGRIALRLLREVETRANEETKEGRDPDAR